MRALQAAVVAAMLLAPASGVSQSAPAGYDEPMQRVRVGARTVAYHVLGTDRTQPPLVLIAGGPGFDHRYFHLSNVWDRLAQSRRVVFFDHPGMGQSASGTALDSVAVADVLDGMEAIRVALGSERLVPLGHSWGGYVALAYATRFPARVDRLVLVCSAPPKWADIEFLFASIFPDSLARGAGVRFANPADFQQDIVRHVAMSFYSPEHRARVSEALRRDGIPYYAPAGPSLLQDTQARDLTEAAKSVAMPVLVSTGRFDANVSTRTAWRIHRMIPGSRFLVWERSGHYPMVEEPDAFVADIDAFLKGK